MSRPLRIEYAGAWYHVMNRGLARQTIFYNRRAYQLFLDLLEEAHNRYQIQIHAYCLMKNHYHLLVHTPLPNLGRAMRHIDGIYTIKSNRLIGRDGPLFRGRYKANLVEADTYLLQLSKYVHLNPCVAKIVAFPEDYVWSSYNYFLCGGNPNWLYCDETLNHFAADKVNTYKKFVMENVDKDELELKLGKNPILGTEGFIRKIKDEKINNFPILEIPEQINFLRSFYITVSEVVRAVDAYYDSTFIDISNGNKKKNQSRDVAIYLCYHLTGNSFKVLTKEFNHFSISGLSKICQRIELRVKKDKKLKNEIEIIKDGLSKVET